MSILKAALLGKSLTHSISPAVHQALFPIVRSKKRTDYDSIDYSRIECSDEKEFYRRIEIGLREGYAGFNVTFPYKYTASTLAEASPIVKQIHSANTIRCETPLRIISTDGDGFRFAIEKSYRDFQANQYSLIIIGAGGAARAVLHSIYDCGWESIRVAARSAAKATRSVMSYETVTVLPLDKIKRDGARHFVVQATPVGQRTDEALLESFEWRSGDIAVDLVYNPLQTRFLDRAANGGAHAIDGLGMLIEQAALSQYFWMSGVEAKQSLLNEMEFRNLHDLLSKLVTPRWDAFAS